MHDLIDIGANLTHDSFDADRDEVLARARAAGVQRLVITGASDDGNRKAAELAATHPGVLYATAGVHPHHASDYTAESGTRIRELAGRTDVVAVGECGLDYFRTFSPQDAQRDAFRAQLEIAAATGKPVFLHQRDAHDDFVKILNAHIAGISGGVAHCFTGTAAQMHTYLELGLYIGVTGWVCDERRGHDLQEAVRELPPERLLLETDAPYLMPRDLPEKLSARRNEPCVLPHILKAVAGLMDRDEAEIAAAATRNSEKLFGLN
ncbi:MAG: hydrolase TatD [Chromatiales bacterium]|jgi:TatD DNase family protein|nr:hydrolase TatD [Chromatiales bacterium]MDP6150666.1 TatD family hydrolase [Gammaproteobacteria bacterium]MDP7269958.1 TatD family hydrolase [Gammaproteobacteria bacterium]HJP05494.1 TatD family hydrolase [Gammaproteobacteria bacterium]